MHDTQIKYLKIETEISLNHFSHKIDEFLLYFERNYLGISFA